MAVWLINFLCESRRGPSIFSKKTYFVPKATWHGLKSKWSRSWRWCWGNRGFYLYVRMDHRIGKLLLTLFQDGLLPGIKVNVGIYALPALNSRLYKTHSLLSYMSTTALFVVPPFLHSISMYVESAKRRTVSPAEYQTTGSLVVLWESSPRRTWGHPHEEQCGNGSARMSVPHMWLDEGKARSDLFPKWLEWSSCPPHCKKLPDVGTMQISVEWMVANEYRNEPVVNRV